MSDSLRDQLLQAGFKPAAKTEQKKNHAKKHKRASGTRAHSHSNDAKGSANAKAANGAPTASHTAGKKQSRGKKSSAKKEPIINELSEIERLEAIERKEKKQKIATLIESNAVKDHKGDAAYSYMAGNKVRQMFVSEDCRNKLANSELVITRLNGNTWLIPPDIGEAILSINPDWAVIANKDASEESGTNDDYADFQIPDDLQW